VLAREGRVCTRLVVVMETEHGERSERSWYRSSGLSAAAMVERVRWQLDAWIDQPRGSDQEITGGVTWLRLIPDEVVADVGLQLGLWGGQSDADRRAARAVARLSAMAGEEAVTVPRWQGGRLPADRYRWIPAITVDLDDRVQPEPGCWAGALPPPSPATVLASAVPIDFLDADGRQVEVSGRATLSAHPAALRVLSGDETSGWIPGAMPGAGDHDEPSGGSRRTAPGDVQVVTAWAGPWPIEERWWDPTRARRLAGFQVTVEAGAAYVVVAERRRWWITAIYG
jgi:protein ImuB